MTKKLMPGESQNTLAIHQYYMDIINCMPNIVYWVDTDCLLKGCNTHFIQWLGLTQLNDFVGTPYDQMAQRLSCPATRIESFKLDDMAVLFSGEAEYNVEATLVYEPDDEVIYYHITRIPLFDIDKRVTGLVVILTNITAHKVKEQQRSLAKPSTPPTNRDERLNTPLRVLIVEDNVVAQKAEQAILTALNCLVDVADSGDTAAQLFVPGKYALVFMDIGLADTSGYIVSKTLRLMEKNTEHHVPIIALTSYQADVVKYDCNDYFMDGVMTKPLTSDRAMQIIKRYVYQEDLSVANDPCHIF